jgi:hypothetical protein
MVDVGKFAIDYQNLAVIYAHKINMCLFGIAIITAFSDPRKSDLMGF